MVVSGPDDVPLNDGEVMPDEFRLAPLISASFLDAGFLSKVAWATASMDHFSTHGKIVLRLKLKRGDTTVDSDSAVAVSEELLPRWLRLSARVNLSTPGECGYRADASATFSAWMGFPIPKTGNLFTWGLTTISDSKPAYQPQCPPSTVSPSDSEWLEDLLGEDYWQEEETEYSEEYEGECNLCQLWFLILESEIIGIWWECTQIDESYCWYLDDAR
jgi:hypothetical protein